MAKLTPSAPIQWLLGFSSSNVERIGYQAAESRLYVGFLNGSLNGSLYVYYDVPLDVFTALAGASSKGKSFNILVKEAGYAYNRIE